MNRIVTFALEQRMLMILVTLFLFGAGIVSFTRLNIEAYPDPAPRVEVITQSHGLVK
jgi:heavy metal efflux system protein